MRKTSFVALLVVGALMIPLGVFASHQFNDVPDSHTFHNAIDWMKDNNITVGCNPPANNRFCPDDNVTRGQMSAFMKRLAENNVVDAATLDGKDSTEFALASSSGSMTLGAASFTADAPGGVADWTNGCMRNSAAPFDVRASVQLPVGAVVTSISARLIDGNAANATFALKRVTTNVPTLASVTTSGTPANHIVSANLATAETVDSGESFYVEYFGGDGSGLHQICGAEIFYDIPAGTNLLGQGAPESGPEAGTE